MASATSYRIAAAVIAISITVLVPVHAQDLTPEERWASELAVYHSQDWLSWAQKMPIDAALPQSWWADHAQLLLEQIRDTDALIALENAEIDEIKGKIRSLHPVDSDISFDKSVTPPLRVHLASQTAPVSPYLFSVKFSPITTVSLGRRKNAILTNVRVCNTDSRPVVLPQEQLLMASTDLSMLTAVQATWLLSQKRDMQWAVMFERAGTLGLGLGAAFAGVPYVAAAIPLLQQIIDYAKTRQPDITPFLAEMLPLEIPLSAAGIKGDCATGSLFAAKKGNTL